MKRLIYLPVTILILISCSESDQSGTLLFSEDNKWSSGESEGSVVDPENGHIQAIRNQVIIDDILYKIDILSALDYLKIKNEDPSSADIPELEKESVLIFEIQTLEAVQDIFRSQKIKRDKEDAIKYLMDQISADMTLIQDENEYSPTGMQYDGMLTSANKIRLFVFYKDVNVKELITFKFYDRLFGAGLINLKHKEN